MYTNEILTKFRCLPSGCVNGERPNKLSTPSPSTYIPFTFSISRNVRISSRIKTSSPFLVP